MYKRRDIENFLKDHGFSFHRDNKRGELWKDVDGKIVCVSNSSMGGCGYLNFKADVMRVVKQRSKPVPTPAPKVVAQAPKITPNKFIKSAVLPVYRDTSPASLPEIHSPIVEPTPAPIPEVKSVTPPVEREVEAVLTQNDLKRPTIKNAEQNALYNTEVKRRSRKTFRKFIKKKLHRVDPRETKVLCLAGAEALEIFQIYDKLEIPRKNIVCLERVKLFHDQIKDMNLGIQLHHTTVKEYFENNPGVKFHVISLDYMGMLYKHVDDLRALAKFKHMHEECVVFTNFCGSREKAEAKALYMQYTADHSADLDTLRSNITAIIKTELQSNGSMNYLDVVGYEELSLLRLKKDQVDLFEKRISGWEHDPEFKEKFELYNIMLENFANNDGLNNQLEEYLQGNIEHTIRTLFRLKFDVKTDETTRGGEAKFFYSYKTDTKSLFVEDETTYMPYEGAVSVLRLAAEEYFYGQHHKVYDIKSCRYVGYSGIPMLCDMFFLKKEKPFDLLKGKLNDHGETFAQIFFPFFDKLTPIQIKNLITKCKDYLLNQFRVPVSEREELGYESQINPRPDGDYSEEYDLEVLEAEVTAEPVVEKPPSFKSYSEGEKKHNFSQEYIISLARSLVIANPTMTSYEIAAKVPGCSIGTAAALCAHRTMGSYANLSQEELEALKNPKMSKKTEVTA